MSSPKAFQERWRQIDEDLKDSYMTQIKQVIKRVFHEYCKEMMVEHPMLESALQQIVEIEGEATRKEKLGIGTGNDSTRSRSMMRQTSNQSLGFQRM